MNKKSIEEEIKDIASVCAQVREITGSYIVGNQNLVETILIGVLSDGHVLIEGVPGTAKTTIVKLVSIMLGCESRRLQCAVDTQPSDIIGIRIWNQRDNEFEFKRGPVFTNIMLIDEINRLPPRSQSAFIEAMSERQVTVDGRGIKLNKPFFTIATQNPFEQEGTFPLIEAQKDRFMFSINSKYLDADDELEIISREQKGSLNWSFISDKVKPLLSAEKIDSGAEAVKEINVEPPVLEYMRDIIVATRKHGDVRLGASSRGSIALLRGSKALAAINGRTYVTPDDVKAVAHRVLQHRIILKYESEISSITTADVIDQILGTIEVP